MDKPDLAKTINELNKAFGEPEPIVWTQIEPVCYGEIYFTQKNQHGVLANMYRNMFVCKVERTDLMFRPIDPVYMAFAKDLIYYSKVSFEDAVWGLGREWAKLEGPTWACDDSGFFIEPPPEEP